MVNLDKCCMCGLKSVTVIDGVAPLCGKCYLGHKERLPGGAGIKFAACCGEDPIKDVMSGAFGYTKSHIPDSAAGGPHA